MPTNQGSDPKQSIPILEYLRSRGLTDVLFTRLHHREFDAINLHIAYCKKTREFREGGTNARLQLRLQFLSELIVKERPGNTPLEPGQLRAFVDKALAQYPLK